MTSSSKEGEGSKIDHLPVVSKFDIQFNDGDSLIVHGGELLKGTILVQLNEKTTLQAVKVQIKGRATWLGDGSAKGEFEKVYFNQDMTLLERPPGRLEPGHFPWVANFLYTLPFECPIPKGCPTSYEGPFGSIRYYVKATLVEEDEHGQRGVTKEHYVKKAFMLISPYERIPHSDGQPINISDSELYGKCCCKGKVSGELLLSKSVFTSGEDVFGTIKVNGKKIKNIMDQIEVRLVDRVVRVGTPIKMGASPYRTILAHRLERSDKKDKKSTTMDGVYFFTIPSLSPSTKGNFDDESGEVIDMIAPNGFNTKQFPGIMESPSTATLRFRRQPFIRIQYAIQASIHNIVILEAPITIAELNHKDNPLRAFICGSQPIEESSDSDKSSFGGPFSYTPYYPIHEVKESSQTVINGLSNTVSNTDVSSSSPPKEPIVDPILVSNIEIDEKKVEGPEDDEEKKDFTYTVVSHSEDKRIDDRIDEGEEVEEKKNEEEEVEERKNDEEGEDKEVKPIIEEPNDEMDKDHSSSLVETHSEPHTETSTHTEENVEDVLDENGEVIGQRITRRTTTKNTTSQIVETSGAGDEAIAEIKERLEDGWGDEGDEGVTTTVESNSSVLHGHDGQVIATTTTTKVLKRVKREVGGNEEEKKEVEESIE